MNWNWSIAIVAARMLQIDYAIQGCIALLTPLSEEERCEQEEWGLPTDDEDEDEVMSNLTSFEDELDFQLENLIYLSVEV